MGKSSIYTVNTASNTLTAGSTVPLGNVTHRYGCNLVLSGNAISLRGSGYYGVYVSLTVSPTAAGTVTAQLCKDGSAVSGAQASATTSAASQSVCLAFPALVRIKGCCCSDTSELTILLSGADSVVSDVTVKVDKQ